MSYSVIDINFEDPSGAASVLFQGDLVLDNISGIKQKIDTFLSSWDGNKISLKIAKVSALDLSFMQLVIVLLSHLKLKGVETLIVWNLDDELQKLISQAGFEKYSELWSM